MGEGRKELLVLFLVIVFVIIEWIGRRNEYAIEKLFTNQKRWVCWGFYYLIIGIIISMLGKQQEFIYFQF